MPLLITRLSNYRLNATLTQIRSVPTRRVRLVTQRRNWTGAATNLQLFHQRNEQRRITILPGRADRHQR
jgi:hypothetical protein